MPDNLHTDRPGHPPADVTFIDQIVEIRLHGVQYRKQEVEAVINEVKKAAGSQPIYVLVEANERSSVSFDGVRALFTDNALSYARAKAYVLKNEFHFKIGDICMLVFAPKTPLKFFRDRHEARTWLTNEVNKVK